MLSDHGIMARSTISAWPNGAKFRMRCTLSSRLIARRLHALTQRDAHAALIWLVIHRAQLERAMQQSALEIANGKVPCPSARLRTRACGLVAVSEWRALHIHSARALEACEGALCDTPIIPDMTHEAESTCGEWAVRPSAARAVLGVCVGRRSHGCAG